MFHFNFIAMGIIFVSVNTAKVCMTERPESRMRATIAESAGASSTIPCTLQ